MVYEEINISPFMLHEIVERNIFIFINEKIIFTKRLIFFIFESINLNSERLNKMRIIHIK